MEKKYNFGGSWAIIQEAIVNHLEHDFIVRRESNYIVHIVDPGVTLYWRGGNSLELYGTQETISRVKHTLEDKTGLLLTEEE